MALVSRIGSLLKQTGSKHANMGLSASNSSLYQTIRSMSSSKLFVGGLSYSTDENGLRQAFDQYGQVLEAKVVTDRETGRSRGFGFISFTSYIEANKALLEMDGQELHGRRVRINFATEKPRLPSKYYGHGGGGYGGGGDNAGNVPSFDGLGSGFGGNSETPLGGGAEQSVGFQGNVNDDFEGDKFGDDNDEPNGYANTRN